MNIPHHQTADFLVGNVQLQRVSVKKQTFIRDSHFYISIVF